MTSRRVAIRVALLAALALVAVACSGGARPSLASDGASTTTDGSGGSSATDGTEVEPKSGGTLRFGIDGPIVADPAHASPASHADLMVLDLLYDGLTAHDGNEVVPAIALGWRQLEGGRLWRFTLREGATFSDGSQVTGAVVKASLEHTASAGIRSFTATRLEPISGYTDFAAGAAESISGIVVHEDQPRVVDIRTDRPYDALPDLLASPVYGIVDPEHVRASDVRTTGPLVEPSAANGVLELEARPEAGLFVAKVELHSFPDAPAALEALATHQVDWAPLDEVSPPPEGSIEVSTPFQTELFLGLNSEVAPLDDVDLRRAISVAVDRTALLVSGDAPGADALAVVVPAGVEGHDPEACGDRCEADPDAAAELLDEAYPDGEVPTVPLDFDDTPEQERLMEAVADQLEEVGIPTELRPQPVQDYAEAVASGDQAVFSFGWIGLFPTPEAYLPPLFHSRSADNLVGADSATLDRALERGEWAEAEQEALDDALVVPLSQFRTRAAIADRVRGLEHQIDGSFDITTVWLDSGDPA